MWKLWSFCWRMSITLGNRTNANGAPTPYVVQISCCRFSWDINTWISWGVPWSSTRTNPKSTQPVKFKLDEANHVGQGPTNRTHNTPNETSQTRGIFFKKPKNYVQTGIPNCSGVYIRVPVTFTIDSGPSRTVLSSKIYEQIDDKIHEQNRNCRPYTTLTSWGKSIKNSRCNSITITNGRFKKGHISYSSWYQGRCSIGHGYQSRDRYADQ